MKKNRIHFLKSLIFSDFSVIYKKIKNIHMNKKLLLNTNINIGCINMFVLSKNLKQLIKILQFYLNHKKLFLSIFTQTYAFKKLLEHRLKKKTGKKRNIRIFYSRRIFKKGRLYGENIILSTFANGMSVANSIELLKSKNCLLFFVSLRCLKKEQGIYFLQNSIDNLKKNIFLASIIRKFY